MYIYPWLLYVSATLRPVLLFIFFFFFYFFLSFLAAFITLFMLFTTVASYTFSFSLFAGKCETDEKSPLCMHIIYTRYFFSPLSLTLILSRNSRCRYKYKYFYSVFEQISTALQYKWISFYHMICGLIIIFKTKKKKIVTKLKSLFNYFILHAIIIDLQGSFFQLFFFFFLNYQNHIVNLLKKFFFEFISIMFHTNMTTTILFDHISTIFDITSDYTLAVSTFLIFLTFQIYVII